jgi:hypothetical protein
MSDNEKYHDGIFLVDGGQLTLGNISLSIDEDGNVTGSPVEISLRFDVCPEWLQIAYSHLAANKLASDKIIKGMQDEDDEAIGKALKEEFRSGMQAIVAACTALDSFYEIVKEHADIPEDVIVAWGKKRTAKYARISEAVKVGFGVSNQSANKIRNFLKESFSYRDRAIHPNQQFLSPAVHPELNRAVDFKFVLFRHHNAKAIMQLTLSFIYQLCTFDKIKNEAIQTYADQLKTKLVPLVDTWKSEYGDL